MLVRHRDDEELAVAARGVDGRAIQRVVKLDARAFRGPRRIRVAPARAWDPAVAPRRRREPGPDRTEERHPGTVDLPREATDLHWHSVDPKTGLWRRCSNQLGGAACHPDRGGRERPDRGVVRQRQRRDSVREGVGDTAVGLGRGPEVAPVAAPSDEPVADRVTLPRALCRSAHKQAYNCRGCQVHARGGHPGVTCRRQVLTRHWVVRRVYRDPCRLIVEPQIQDYQLVDPKCKSRSRLSILEVRLCAELDSIFVNRSNQT